MRYTDSCRIFGATISIGALTMVGCAGPTGPQGGHGDGMMGSGLSSGWMGGYGGPWMLVVVVLVAGLVAWLVARGKNKS